MSSARRTSKISSHRHRKFTSYSGDTKWITWYNQFKETASGLSTSDKLKELKSHLKGEAADFVFDQLHEKVRKDYNKLKLELKNRFHKVESRKTYGAMFSKRIQKNETVESYANDLKKLYDKAYPNRNGDIRKEDLLAKFFDGLNDQHCAMQLQTFMKGIKDIDAAVEETVHYQQLNKGKSRLARVAESDSGTDVEEDIRVFNNVQQRPNRGQQDLGGRFPKLYGTTQATQMKRPNLKAQGCFYCGDPSHFIKDCPTLAVISQNQNMVAPNTYYQPLSQPNQQNLATSATPPIFTYVQAPNLRQNPQVAQVPNLRQNPQVAQNVQFTGSHIATEMDSNVAAEPMVGSVTTESQDPTN